MLFCFVFLFNATKMHVLLGSFFFVSGICLAIGILAFPAGWDNDHIRSICGNSDDYELGDCGIRWAFVLAIIAFFDCWILGCLAFTLAHRVVVPQPEPQYMSPQSIYKGRY